MASQWTYPYILDTVRTTLLSHSSAIGVDPSAIVEDAEGVRQSLAPPFVVVTATPQETDLRDASEKILQNNLDLIVFAGVESKEDTATATREAIALAGRILRVFDNARDSSDLFAEIFTANAPIEYVGRWSDKTIVSLHFTVPFTPFADLLS